jgi:translation initiation factor IF-1
MPETPISTTATILARHSPAAFLASLPNGKTIVCHLPGNLVQLAPQLAPGSQVKVELTPYDFDHARIAALTPPP